MKRSPESLVWHDHFDDQSKRESNMLLQARTFKRMNLDKEEWLLNLVESFIRFSPDPFPKIEISRNMNLISTSSFRILKGTALKFLPNMSCARFTTRAVEFDTLASNPGNFSLVFLSRPLALNENYENIPNFPSLVCTLFFRSRFAMGRWSLPNEVAVYTSLSGYKPLSESVSSAKDVLDSVIQVLYSLSMISRMDLKKISPDSFLSKPESSETFIRLWTERGIEWFGTKSITIILGIEFESDEGPLTVESLLESFKESISDPFKGIVSFIQENGPKENKRIHIRDRLLDMCKWIRTTFKFESFKMSLDAEDSYLH